MTKSLYDAYQDGTLNSQAVMAAARRQLFDTSENVGFCLDCGHEQNVAGPTVEGMRCHRCFRSAVASAELLALRGEGV
jgi:hypothetical protein